ncbi:MAG TPA: preprotein translocase subunit SecG [Verrucomicrobiae bacterium]|nr:preprotein translocase subunit SecG [Verrucomicrobiae bacterium]
MYTFLVVIQVLAAVGVIGLVLIQHGKGADAGAAFGSGASGTVFGSRGAANFLTRATAGCATVFFLVSLSLAYLVQARKAPDSVVDTLAPAPVAAPQIPTEAPVAAPTEPKAPEVPE